MSRVLSFTTPMSQTEALLELDVPRRTFERKRSIAELMIFDRPEFDKLVDELAKTSSRQRNIRQEKMIAECSKILERPALKIKRRQPIDKLCGSSQRSPYQRDRRNLEPRSTWRTECWGEEDAELLTVWMLISLTVTSYGWDSSSLPQDKTNRDCCSLKN